MMGSVTPDGRKMTMASRSNIHLRMDSRLLWGLSIPHIHEVSLCQR